MFLNSSIFTLYNLIVENGIVIVDFYKMSPVPCIFLRLFYDAVCWVLGLDLSLKKVLVIQFSCSNICILPFLQVY